MWHRRQLHLSRRTRLAGHRRRLRRRGRSTRHGRKPPRTASISGSSRPMSPAVRGGHRVGLRADRRQRLSARHERRRPPRLRAGGDGGRRARCTAAAGRVHPRQFVRRTWHRPCEVAPRFATAWTLLSSGSEPAMDHNGKDPAATTCFSAPRRARRPRAGSPSARGCAGVRRRRRTRRARCTPAVTDGPGP